MLPANMWWGGTTESNDASMTLCLSQSKQPASSSLGFADHGGGAGRGMCIVVSLSRLFRNLGWQASNEGMMVFHAETVLDFGARGLERHLPFCSPNEYARRLWWSAEVAARWLRVEGSAARDDEYTRMTADVWECEYPGMTLAQVDADYVLLLRRVVQRGFFMGDLTLINAMVDSHTQLAMSVEMMTAPLVIVYVLADSQPVLSLSVTYGDHLDGEAQHAGFLTLERLHYRFDASAPDITTRPGADVRLEDHDVASLDRRIMSLSNENQELATQEGCMCVGSVGFKYDHTDLNPLQRDT